MYRLYLVLLFLISGMILGAGQSPRLAHAETAHSAARKVTSVRIYLIAIGDNGRSGEKIGCGDSVIAVTRPIAPTTAPLSAALRLLIGNHHRSYGQSDLYNALYQASLRLVRATVTRGKAVVHLAGRLNLRGVCDDPRAGAQLRETVRQFPSVRSVAIYINNVPLSKVLSER